MQYAMCLKTKIIHSIEEQDLLIEVLNVEPLKHHGYCVIAIDDDDQVHEVIYVDGNITIH